MKVFLFYFLRFIFFEKAVNKKMSSRLLDGSGDWKKPGTRKSHLYESKYSGNELNLELKSMMRRQREKQKSLLNMTDIRDADTVSQITTESPHIKLENAKKRSRRNMPFQLMKMFTKLWKRLAMRLRKQMNIIRRLTRSVQVVFWRNFTLVFSRSTQRRSKHERNDRKCTTFFRAFLNPRHVKAGSMRLFIMRRDSL